jgi:hypothetical protein
MKSAWKLLRRLVAEVYGLISFLKGLWINWFLDDYSKALTTPEIKCYTGSKGYTASSGMYADVTQKRKRDARHA